jgi:hypothetical protein
MVADPNQMLYSTQVTSGSATVTAQIQNVGDLVLLFPWCISTCTISTLTLGAQSATCDILGSSNASAGQPNICHVIANTSGALTVTFTPGGSPSGWQVAYQDFSLSGQTSVAFDLSATSNCSSGCSEGTTVTLPSITPSVTGELLANFVTTLNHGSGPHSGSPQWSCYMYLSGANIGTCQMPTTQNDAAWIVRSASGATTANMNILTNNDPYQSLIAAYKFTSTAPVACAQSMTLLGLGCR